MKGHGVSKDREQGEVFHEEIFTRSNLFNRRCIPIIDIENNF